MYRHAYTQPFRLGWYVAAPLALGKPRAVSSLTRRVIRPLNPHPIAAAFESCGLTLPDLGRPSSPTLCRARKEGRSHHCRGSGLKRLRSDPPLRAETSHWRSRALSQSTSLGTFLTGCVLPPFQSLRSCGAQYPSSGSNNLPPLSDHLLSHTAPPAFRMRWRRSEPCIRDNTIRGGDVFPKNGTPGSARVFNGLQHVSNG